MDSTPHLATLILLAAAQTTLAQWQMQESRTNASLRGIHSVDGSVAWASGTSGTVLRTTDGGSHWQKCATPPAGDSFDFRGIWSWDSLTAFVMASGPGERSRLYKTNDGCLTWTADAQNSEKDGFWDTMAFQTQDFGFLGDLKTGILIGDPIRGRFQTEAMTSAADGWLIDMGSCAARDGEAAFAASNSSAVVFGNRRYIIVTGGKAGPRALLSQLLAYNDSGKPCLAVPLPLAGGADSAGAFSVAFRDLKHGLVVGGDYKKPEATAGTAAFTVDGGLHWSPAVKPPHGYRSSVAWYAEAQCWIAAGTNGSDISRDDGNTWQPLDDGNWNAVSPPYVVGPNGRIAKLNPDAYKRSVP